MSGPLTSNVWDDRKLGVMDMARCVNDRFWIITGDNVALGGDLPRRSLRTVIDSGMPHPELRTGFETEDLEGWARNRHGDLIAALLRLIRAWVVAG